MQTRAHTRPLKPNILSHFNLQWNEIVQTNTTCIPLFYGPKQRQWQPPCEACTFVSLFPVNSGSRGDEIRCCDLERQSNSDTTRWSGARCDEVVDAASRVDGECASGITLGCNNVQRGAAFSSPSFCGPAVVYSVAWEFDALFPDTGWLNNRLETGFLT